MHSTKSDILALLKRSSGASVEELSTTLGLASMTVRQHLIALERDGLLRATEVRRATGRPHYRYELTAEGHRHLSDGYDRLLGLVVETVGRLDGLLTAAPDAQARRQVLFREAAGALAERHRVEVSGLPEAARADRVVAILRSHGGYAEWHEAQDGIEVRDFSCVFRQTVGSDGPCEWHETFLSRILDLPVRDAPPPGDGCAACCCYTIPLRASAPAANRGNR
jgi:predicted ArsR family transcriptional regulator